MTEEEKNLFAGINIDPETWEDPKQSFPGEIVTSEFRMASDKYRAETEFRPAITEDLPQWNLVVRRLDAIRQELDGSHGDVIYYGGVDLKRWRATANDGQGGLVPLSSRYPKEWFITTAYKNVFGTVHPPDVLTGKKAQFDYYPTKAFGTVTARRVLVPANVLAPDYEFTGDKHTFIARERDDENPATEGTDVPSTGGSTDLLSKEEAMALLPPLFVGLKIDAVADLIEAMPKNVRLPELLNAVATGDLVKQLQADGKLTIDADTGIIHAPPTA